MQGPKLFVKRSFRFISVLVPAVALAAAGAGCDPDAGTPPSETELREATALTSATVEGGKRARAALDILAVLPSFDCSASRASMLLDAVETLATSASCAVVSTASVDSETDTMSLAFAQGCAVSGHAVEGPAIITLSGSSGSLVVEADLSALVVDGEVLAASAGYGACDAGPAWVDLEGSAGGGIDFTLEVEGVKGDGQPFGGGGTILFDGSATLTRPEGSDDCVFEDVAWDAGDALPNGGRLVFETATGHHVEVVFDDGSPETGAAEIIVDGHASVMAELSGA